jgi:hypothetical protein
MHERPRPSGPAPPRPRPRRPRPISPKSPRGGRARPLVAPQAYHRPCARPPRAPSSGFWLLASASGFFWGAGNREQGTRTRRTRHKTTHYTLHKARARQPPPGARSQEQIALFNSSLSHAPVHRAPEETPPVVGSQTRPHGASRTGRGK